MKHTRRVNPFTIEGLFEILRRNVQAACITISIGILVALIFYYRTPRIYNADMRVLIPTSFFTNTGALNDGINTPDSEIEAYRLIYAKDTLSDYFLDTLGERYNLFDLALDDPKHSIERQELRLKFQILVSAQSTIEVSITAATGEEAASMLEDYFKELLKVLRRKAGNSEEIADSALATLIEEPVIPDTPIYPHVWDYINAGFALGLLVALCQLIYREYRMTQFLFPEEVATYLGIEFLGDLPEISRLEWLYLLDHVRAAQQKLIEYK